MYVPSTYENLPVTAIGINAFRNNTDIQKIVMPLTVKTIHGGAFYGCTELQTVIMQGVTEIITSTTEYEHFKECTKLTTIMVGDSFNVSVGAGTSGQTQRVFYQDWGTSNITKVLLKSTDGQLSIYNQSVRNNLLIETPYHFSSTEKSGCWYFDADGNVAFWE